MAEPPVPIHLGRPHDLDSGRWRHSLALGLWILQTTGSASAMAVVALTGLTTVFSQFFSRAFAASLAKIVQKDDMPRASGRLR